MTSSTPLLAFLGFFQDAAAPAQHAAGGEAALVLPNLNQAVFLGGIGGRALLLWGLVICALGLLFGLAQYTQLRNLPVHRAMREISELIYETCKTYLLTQGRFLLILWVFIGAIVALYFGTLAQTTDATGAMVRGFPATKVVVILLFSLIGIAGSYGVALSGISRQHLRQLAHRVREPDWQAVPGPRNPAQGGDEHRHAAHQRRAAADADDPALRPRRLRRPLFHRLRHRRIARCRGAPRGGRHLHQDRRHRRRPDEDRLQDQGRRRA